MKEQFISCIENPQIFALNRLAPHADFDVLEQDGSVRQPLSLDGKWDFAYVADVKLLTDALLAGCGCTDTISVPAHMQLEGFGRPQYTNVAYPWDGHDALEPPALPAENPAGVYKRTFPYLAEWAGRRVCLCIGGAEPACFVVLNGTFIGYGEDGFTPSEFDLTPFLVQGENVLTITVPRFSTASWLEDQDFWRFSGLFRTVSLRICDPVHIFDIELLAEPAADMVAGLLQACVRVRSDCIQQVRVRIECGGRAEERAVQLLAGETAVSLSVLVPNARLWSAETPNLYEARVRVLAEGGIVLAGVSQQIGFRRFALQDGLMKLNGKRIAFYGVNRHEWSFETGRAITENEIERDIVLLKRYNCNAIRCSHYPNHPAFYSLCDRYGMYVIDETNLETHGTWMLRSMGLPQKNVLPDDNGAYSAAVLDRGRSMLERDKNHACVLIWSCGNESYGGKTLHDLSEYFRTRDPHRLVHYEGIFHDRRYPGTSDMESRMYEKPDRVRRYLAKKPKKPLILCEYAHAMGNSFGNVDEYIRLMDAYPMFQGGFIWDFVDQALKRADGTPGVGGDFDDRPNDGYFCGDGLVFADRTPQPKLDEMKFLYAPVRLTVTASGETGVWIENRRRFAGTGDLLFSWTLEENGIQRAEGVFNQDVPPGEKAFVPLAFPAQNDAERVVIVSALLASDTPYAPAGHEVAFGQGVSPGAPKKKPAPKAAALVPGLANRGARMPGASAIVDRVSGLLVSLNKGRELLLRPVCADFWRAPTDNDVGNHSPQRWAKWKAASLYRQSSTAFFRRGKDGIYAFFRSGRVFWRMDYRFYADDSLDLTLRLFPTPGDVPQVGVTFVLPADVCNMKWYGNGEREASCDRRNACRIGIYESTVAEQLVPYLHPQYCANKTDLRYLTLTDSAGRGMTLSADVPFEASMLPWTSHELENAKNIAALPPVSKTVVTVAQKRCGVGGDDSWGAPVHKKHRIPTGRGAVFTLHIQLHETVPNTVSPTE